MSIELALNPLKIIPGKGMIESVDIEACWQALRSKLQELALQTGYLVIWQVHGISWGKLQAGSLSFSSDEPKVELILELRVFNEKAEIYLQKQGDKFIGRYRNDESGEDIEYVDSASRFWGSLSSSEAEEAEAFMTLVDRDRKISMKIPGIGAKAKYYALVTRSYIGINKQTAQAGYTDYRFKEIIPADMKGDD